jgi:hypothetical protein
VQHAKERPVVDPQERLEVQCAWCLRVLVEGTWIDGAPVGALVSHGMCPDCLDRLRPAR